jgi:hypothetical protein
LAYIVMPMIIVHHTNAICSFGGAKAEVYAAAVRKAVDSLVAERLLLPEDATRLIAEADSKGVRAGP